MNSAGTGLETDMMRILLVEEERRVGDHLQQELAEAGYVTDLARDSFAGRDHFLKNDYDLLILDVTQPGLNRWDLLRMFRKSGKDTSVLFLIGVSGIDDRVKGSDVGADDYLIKPFAFAELLARVRTLLRRKDGEREADVLRIADLELDLCRRRAFRGGHWISLTAQEFALLELLMRRSGEVLLRAVLAKQVWDLNCGSGTSAITVAIKRLRAKVDGPFEPRLIRTVRGMGYVLEAP